VAALTIARLTIQEASRRRLLLALLLLTLAVIALTGWGFSRLWSITPGGRPITEVQVRLIASQLLILVAFMFSAVLALSAVLVASPSISGDLESGLALAMLSRPVRRADMLVGKLLGLAFLVVLYAVASGALEMLVVDRVTGYAPPHPVELLAYLSTEGVVLLVLSLLLSTRLSGMTGGVIALVAFFMAWMGGIVGGIGIALQNQTLANAGTVSTLLLPTDALWRGAVYSMEPASVLAALRTASAGAAANPFAAPAPPSSAYLAWVAAWLVAIVGLALWSFRTREV
jgi:ABC-type transport system involved in multi-copper enzyme maturation permease subunit